MASKEALKISLIVMGAAVVAAWLLQMLLGEAGFMFALILGGLALAFTFYFFRDPERKVPEDKAVIVAAADGLVVGVEEIEEKVFGLGRMRRVAIFLSVMDVHINRAPVEGTVEKTVHQPGIFLDVRHPDCSAKNEALAWKIKTDKGPVVVRQIAGLIARRIVQWSGEGEMWQRGDKFGMIRFGSRTEVFLPLSCEILVKVGDRVAGASSPIARWQG